MRDDEEIYLVDDLIMPAEEEKPVLVTKQVSSRVVKFIYYALIIFLVAMVVLWQWATKKI